MERSAKDVADEILLSGYPIDIVIDGCRELIKDDFKLGLASVIEGKPVSYAVEIFKILQSKKKSK